MSSQLPEDEAGRREEERAEPAEGEAAGDEPWEAGGGGETSGRPRGGAGRIEAGSVLDLADESCPKCGAPLGAADVVCIKCGFDLREMVQRQPEEVSTARGEAEEEAELEEPFVTPGRGSPQVLAILGGAVTAGAMIAAGVGAPPGVSGWVILAAVLVVLYEVIVHTGTGLVAVAIAARINEERFGGEEAVPLAAARVFVAMAVFELVLHLMMPLHWVLYLLAWPAAGAAYWLVVWGLFNKTKVVALVIVLAQVILWVLVRLGMELAAWHARAIAAAGTAAGAGAGGA